MNLDDFLSPVRQSLTDAVAEQNPQLVGHQLSVHTEVEGIPELENCQVALLGVMEDRGSAQRGAAQAPDAVREYLYPLFWGNWSAQVCDLGNIYAGETCEDTYAAVREVCYQLIKESVIPVILGGTQDITYANYRAYDRLEQTVNLVSVDARFDLGQQGDKLGNHSFLSHIILQQPYLLFNYSNLGLQTYFVSQEEIELMDRMYFDVHRLGQLRNNIAEVEPIMRDTDIASFDLSAVRQSDAPGNTAHSPNGFTGEEACAMARYAGISDKLNSFGLYEFNPAKDPEGHTAHLAAQMVWYFLEGFNNRKGDYPFASKKDYQRFTVLINEGKDELIFYKSHLSDRWWIEVPMNDPQQTHQRHNLIPCSFTDYKEALENEIPERWWRASQK